MKDPVCGMTVTDKSFYRVEHLGQTHYFCGENCKARFTGSRPKPVMPYVLRWPVGVVLLLALLTALLMAR